MGGERGDVQRGICKWLKYTKERKIQSIFFQNDHHPLEGCIIIALFHLIIIIKVIVNIIRQAANIRQDGSTALYAAFNVDTVYTVYTVDTVYTVYTF